MEHQVRRSIGDTDPGDALLTCRRPEEAADASPDDGADGPALALVHGLGLDCVAGRKLASGIFRSPAHLASGLEHVQPANDTWENGVVCDECTSESCYWTAKDPIRFDAQDTNLYRYADGDPVNRRDATGRDASEVAACAICQATRAAVTATCFKGAGASWPARAACTALFLETAYLCYEACKEPVKDLLDLCGFGSQMCEDPDYESDLIEEPEDLFCE